MLDLAFDMNIYIFPILLILSHSMGLGIDCSIDWGMFCDSIKTFQFAASLYQV